jgi:hypothetical protein
MSAERAARRIVRATRRGEAEPILSLPAHLLAAFHGLFPGTTSGLLGMVHRALLPARDGALTDAARGIDVQDRLDLPLLHAVTGLGRDAVRRYQHLEEQNGKEVAADPPRN